MNEKHFVVNLDRVNGRDSENQDRRPQCIIKGFAFSNDLSDPDVTGDKCLVIAIKRNLIADYAVSDPGFSADPEQTEWSLNMVKHLHDFEPAAYLDPDDEYCAIVCSPFI